MPLLGSISIQVGSFMGQVGPNDCVIIKAGSEHIFSALEQSKFLVADCSSLPESLLNADTEVVSIAKPAFAYIQFVEQQLLYLPGTKIETKTLELLLELLSQQSFVINKDKRISDTLNYINEHLSTELSLSDLTKVAYLSETQLKKRFKQSTGLSCQAYIVQKRMERAKALLLHSDTPIRIVAEKVGYLSQSAFTRRFKQTFGLTPNQIARH